MDGSPRGKRDDPLLSITEAADYLGCSIRFMRYLVANRKVAYLKVGRYVKFEQSELERFIDAGRVAAEDWAQ